METERKPLDQKVVRLGPIGPTLSEMMAAAAASVKSVEVTSDLWRYFVHVLDAIRGRDGQGSLTRRWCVLCENMPHDIRNCDCICHKANHYRDEVIRSGEVDAA